MSSARTVPPRRPSELLASLRCRRAVSRILEAARAESRCSRNPCSPAALRRQPSPRPRALRRDPRLVRQQRPRPQRAPADKRGNRAAPPQAPKPSQPPLLPLGCWGHRAARYPRCRHPFLARRQTSFRRTGSSCPEEGAEGRLGCSGSRQRAIRPLAAVPCWPLLQATATLDAELRRIVARTPLERPLLAPDHPPCPQQATAAGNFSWWVLLAVPLAPAAVVAEAPTRQPHPPVSLLLPMRPWGLAS